MDFFSAAAAKSGADPCGICRSGVDRAAGLTDFSRACLAALVSIWTDRPGGARTLPMRSAAFSCHILGSLLAGRRCTSVHIKGNGVETGLAPSPAARLE